MHTTGACYNNYYNTIPHFMVWTGRVHSIRIRWFVFAELSWLWRQSVQITSASVIFMAILRTTEHIDVIGKRVYVTHSFIDNVNFLP